MIIYENLTLKNQDLTIDGDLRLIGKSKICNGNLIVTGTLELLDNSGICELELTNGNLTTDRIYCPYSPSIISINGDITINSGACISNHINSSNNLCGKISCINLHVNGDILLPALEVEKDIFADSSFFCHGFTCGGNAYIKHLDGCDYNVYVSGNLECDECFYITSIKVDGSFKCHSIYFVESIEVQKNLKYMTLFPISDTKPTSIKIHESQNKKHS